MSDQANTPTEHIDHDRWSAWLHWAAWGLLALVLYVLSVGPVAGVATWVWGAEPNWPEWFEAGAATVYLPLVLVAGAIPGGEDTVLAYVGFWESMAR